MSDCPNALSAEPVPAPADARAARLKKFQREQLIVDYLNRGVSVAEIAARVGVGEKRMRAIMREILARRMPHAPMEFVAIQVSRLNEAMLVAFSAMSPSNLKAVDQVVKIVRELDRYGGAFAAEWAQPEAPRLDAPAEEDVAFAKAWLASAELAREGDENGPSAASAASAASAGAERPKIPPEAFEKLESAPRITTTPEASDLAPHASLLQHAPPALAPQQEGGEAAPTTRTVDSRPQNPPQDLEKIESAPGPAPAFAASVGETSAPEEPCRPRSQAAAPNLILIPDSSPGTSKDAAPVLRQAQAVVSTDVDHPQNPPQTPEKIESAPRNGEPAEAAPPPIDDGPMILTPAGWRRSTMRIMLNGVAA